MNGDAVLARWDILRDLVQSARDDCTIFTPFYSIEGLNLIEHSLRRSVAFSFWTRLSLRDWATGVSNPEALCNFLGRLDGTRRPTQLFAHRSLHAKAYFADDASALVGSANLSRGGFEANVELMIQLAGTPAAKARKLLTLASTPGAILVTNDHLSGWISRHATLIKHAKAKLKSELKEIDVAQQETDHEFPEPPIVEPNQALLEEFVKWLADNRTLPAASHLIMLHEDRVVQRQQGHVKQCFAAAFRFLQERPAWMQELANAAGVGDGMVTPKGNLLREWTVHLQSHARASNDLYNYSTLLRELPESRGGTHRGGGGAGTTLKRILPLVARFVLQRAQQNR
ncbi:MAG TPA: phospholipase D-like domain-containing protein [Pirellulales bacterium]|nr:phospholipase D-like domain-containing protein [Pirellulales bacterium]